MASLSAYNFMTEEEKEKMNQDERHYIEHLSHIDAFHRMPSIDKLIEYVKENKYEAYILKSYSRWQGAIFVKVNIINKDKTQKIQKYCILKACLAPQEQGFYFALHDSLNANDRLLGKYPIKYFYVKDIQSLILDEIKKMNENGIKGRFFFR